MGAKSAAVQTDHATENDVQTTNDSIVNQEHISKPPAATQTDSSEDEPISIPSKSKERGSAFKDACSGAESESDDEPISIYTKNKQKKAKTKKISSKKNSACPKRTKKEYDMPGQKKDTPGELDGGRIFYESLRQQNPKSKMAEEYLLKHGLLTYDEAVAIMQSQMKSKGKPSATKNGIFRKNTVKKEKRKEAAVRKEAKDKKSHPKIVEMVSGESSSDDEIIMTKKMRFDNFLDMIS